MPETNEPAPRISRVIDFKVPLPYLLGSLAALAMFLFNLHADVRQLLREGAKTQASVEAGNAQMSSLTAEMALLRFRIETAESDIRTLKDAQPRSKAVHP